MRNHITTLTLIFIFGLLGCGESEITVFEGEAFFPGTKELIKTSLIGQVKDQNDEPIINARVRLLTTNNTQEVITDDKGQFLFESIGNQGSSAYISVAASGKFEAFRRFPVLSDRYNYTEIKMSDRSIIGTVDASQGGSINTSYGASIELPAAGIVDQQGINYTGEVNVAMRWIDPSANDLSENMIGDLSGLGSEGEMRALATYGMLQVELLDENSNKLNLANNTEAILEFPVPESMQSNAPRTIPLWSYDEEVGIWVKEGAATYANGVYQGAVDHFSSWNVDVEFGSIKIEGQVGFSVAKSNSNAAYLSVCVESESIGKVGGWLCEDGSFLFYNFPEGEVFDLIITDDCGNTLYKETYGPYQTDINLGTINLSPKNNSSLVFVQGTALNCQNELVTDGAIAVSLAGKNLYYDIEDDGSFNFSVDLCKGGEAKITILDQDSLIQTELTIDDSKLDWSFAGVSVCDEVVEDYIVFNNLVDEQSFRMTEDIEAVTFEDGAGYLSYAILHLKEGAPECDGDYETWKQNVLDKFLLTFYHNAQTGDVKQTNYAFSGELTPGTAEVQTFEINYLEVIVDEILWFSDIAGRVKGSFIMGGKKEETTYKIITGEFSVASCRIIEE